MQSFCSRFESVLMSLQSLCNRFKMLCSRYIIAPEALCNLFAIAMQSFCSRFEIYLMSLQSL
jgi:hypothetical protein